MKNKVLLVYFSGTGGTKRVAEAFKETFVSNECEVIMHSLDKNEYESYKAKYNEIINKISLIVLLYPVYATQAPLAVYEWINNLPLGINIKTVVISVSGVGDVWPNTSCRVNAIKALERKKYDVFYEKMMVMPSNIFISYSDHAVMHILNSIPEKVNKIVYDVLSGKIRRDKIHLSTRLFCIMHTEKEAKRIGKYLKVGENCSSCGWCVKNCPRANIIMNSNTPTFGDNCTACFRCIYGCPSKAIYIDKGNKLVLKDGFNLETIEKRMDGILLEPIEKCCKGILLKGVRDYLLKNN